MKVRFAPSPTGNLHLGNARIALLNFLHIKKHGGEFILRMDDTDKTRSKPEYMEEIKESLAWMGIEWAKIFFQSKRMELYRNALGKLKAAGRVYACYETPEELDFKRKLQRREGKPPVYDRSALNLSQKEREELERSGRLPYWRFLLDREKEVKWKEVGGKEMKFSMDSISDPVLVREDGLPLYSLSSVVDDGEMGITHIIRGDDHITNTAVQVQMFGALGFAVPKTIHLALVTDEKGSPLSKRSGKSTILGIREEFEPMALNLALAELGNSSPLKPCLNLGELAGKMNFNALGSSSVRFDFERLRRLNQWVIRNQDFAAAKTRLPLDGEKGEAFWNLIRPNVRSWDHALHWCKLVFSDEEVDFSLNWPITAELLSLIEKEVERGKWAHFLEGSGEFSKAQVHAGVRWALTGEKHSPNMLELLKFMTPRVMKKRLATARCLLAGKNKNL